MLRSPGKLTAVNGLGQWTSLLVNVFKPTNAHTASNSAARPSRERLQSNYSNAETDRVFSLGRSVILPSHLGKLEGLYVVPC